MALLKWLCIGDCYVNNTLYHKGDVVVAPSNPSATYFAAWSIYDDPNLLAPPARTDLDGTYYYGMRGWDDFKFPLSSTRVGVTSKPDYDFTNNGYLFPQNDATEILYASDQFPHSMYVGPGSVGKPHLHLIQAANSQVVFKLKIRIYDNNSAVPAFTTLTSTGYGFDYVSGSLTQILIFPDISLEGYSPSAIVDMQLYREDNAYTGDILVKSVDIHIPIDSLGSGQEYFK